MLSNACKYAIRAVTYIAINGTEENKIGLRQISKGLNIPSPFLGKILQLLTRHKLLVSSKGPNGGFSLARDASQITLFNVVEIVDGVDIFDQCILGFEMCKTNPEIQDICPVHAKTGELKTQLTELFKNHTINNLANDLVVAHIKEHF